MTGWVKTPPSHLDGFILDMDKLCGSQDLSSPSKMDDLIQENGHILPNMDGQILKRLDPYHFRFEVTTGQVRSAAIQSDQSVQATNETSM